MFLLLSPGLIGIGHAADSSTLQSLLSPPPETQYLPGIYYGILLAMFLYNLLIFLVSRDFNYMVYAYFLAAWALFQMALNGLAQEHLWPKSPEWGKTAAPFFICAAYGGICQFTRSFLRLKTNLPKIDFILKIHVFLSIAAMVAALVLPYLAAIIVAALVILSASIVILVAAIQCVKLPVRPAKYFVLAWSGLLLGIVVYALRTFGILPNVFITEYAMQIGSAFQILLLTFALAHKARQRHQKIERSLRQANEKLEQAVEQKAKELDTTLRSLSAANNKLKDLSRIDALTGVKNRAYFDEKFDTEWRRAHRGHYTVGLLMLDIDHLKQVNDSHGHPGGDACLKQVAETIRQAIHRPGDDVFRYGNEEFAIILSNTDAKGSAHIGEIMRSEVEALQIAFEGQKIQVTISVGVSSMIPELIGGGSSLIGNAEKALLQAKEDGRNLVRILEVAAPVLGKRLDL